MAGTLTQIEREWFITKSGRGAPLAELKKSYYKSQGAPGNFLAELETNWLIIAIKAAGGTPNSSRDSDLWKQLNAASGYRVAQYENENKMIYYLNSLAAFSPATVSGMVAWFKADSLNLSNDDQVASWSDSSSSGYNLTQGTADNKPTYKTSVQNGKPAVLFDGGTDFMTNADFIIGSGTNRTMFLVLNCDSSKNDQHWVIGGTAFGPANARYGLGIGIYVPNSRYAWLYNYTGPGIEVEPSGSGNTWYYHSYFMNGASSLIRQNGTQIGTGDLGTAPEVQGLRFGGTILGEWFKGYIAEFIVYSGVVADLDRDSIEAYLAAKYAI